MIHINSSPDYKITLTLMMYMDTIQTERQTNRQYSKIDNKHNTIQLDDISTVHILNIHIR